MIMMDPKSFFSSSGNNFFFSDCSLDGEINLRLSSFIPNFSEFFVEIFVFNWEFEVCFERPVFQNKRDEIIFIDICALVLNLVDNGDLDVGSGGGSIFVLFVSEDVDSDDGGFG